MVIAGGKIILDFYGNQLLKSKKEKLAELLKEMHKKFKVSAIEVEDFDDPERCVIGLALVAGTEKGARTAMEKTLEWLNANSFARVVMEDTETFSWD